MTLIPGGNYASVWMLNVKIDIIFHSAVPVRLFNYVCEKGNSARLDEREGDTLSPPLTHESRHSIIVKRHSVG